ncbi:NAD(P)-dependent oxidoreductase [Streptomyces sp. NPDC058439]|uniref:NAD(P)-dependent oxidoreductase n=1 Tax=Streptomyces sp. NPDC058439 TaxID=3346500 RepID=UPI00364EEC15
MTYAAQDRPRIGWIGIGRMGFQLATRLLDAGHDVAVYNRTRSKAEPLAELGATIVDRPSDLSDRDVVFTMVAAAPALEAVTTGPDGVLTSPDAAPGVLIDSSTVSTRMSALIRSASADRGTDFLAVPVSGNPKAIAAGKLTVAVSGSREVFGQVERARGRRSLATAMTSVINHCSRCCIASGAASPACSARGRQFYLGSARTWKPPGRMV